MYLQGALKTYLAEGWALPVAHTRKQLAECQKRLGQTEKYPWGRPRLRFPVSVGPSPQYWGGSVSRP